MILRTFCKIASHFTNYKKIIDCKTHRYRGIVKWGVFGDNYRIIFSSSPQKHMLWYSLEVPQ